MKTEGRILGPTEVALAFWFLLLQKAKILRSIYDNAFNYKFVVYRRFTTEAQRTQRMLFFPWPGDDGQGKEPPPAAKAL